MKKSYFYLLIIPILFFGIYFFTQASDLAVSLSGKILLQVEENGEAWYVSPETKKRSFLGRPDDAFNVMREQGIGISNDNLAKIPVSLDYLSGEDSNGDGLPDAFKEALGLDINSTDSDGDGYDDFTELLNGYNPLGPGKLNHDLNLAKNQAGRILLQVEQNGEAWYVSPENNKRYFLGRPTDAFNVMRNLGLGISNENLDKIEAYKNNANNTILDCINKNDGECFLNYLDLFESRLSSCEPSIGTVGIGFEALFGLYRGYEILGYENSICKIDFWILDYDHTPNYLLNKKMTCEYNEEELNIQTISEASACVGELKNELDRYVSELISSNNEIDTLQKKEDIEVRIDLPKNNFKVGEVIDGAIEYVGEYKGSPFQILILSHNSWGSSRFSFSTNSQFLPHSSAIQKIELTKAGDFYISLYIYDCETVDNQMGTNDCGRGGWPPTIENDKIIANVVPIKSVTENINVTEN